ncbi:MAG: amidohydrolase family protein [candidate division KSB1 bacterium]|nr:amidohydrolase family protein [candidate division KSB1 bacterium]
MQADQVLRGHVVTPDRTVERGWIAMAEGRVLAVGEGESPTCSSRHEFGQAYLLPGLIDLHIHGMEEGDPGSEVGIRMMLRAAPKHGVTGILPSLASSTREGYLRFFENARAAKESLGARLLGVHCEGPHINPRMARGMDPRFLRPPNAEEDDALLAEGDGLLRIMTLSPELPGSVNLIRKLRERGVVASLGHTAASREQVRAAVAAGASHVCHLFNAFPKPEREPDLPDTASYCLEEPQLTLEVILDLVHVPQEKLQLALEKAGVDRLVGVTDGMRGAGLGRGIYPMTDGRWYRIDADGGCRLVESEVLVGTAMTLTDGLRNLVRRMGLRLDEAVRICSTNPARVLGLGNQLGKIAPGYRADIVVFDENLIPLATFVEGRLVWQRDLPRNGGP